MWVDGGFLTQAEEDFNELYNNLQKEFERVGRDNYRSIRIWFAQITIKIIPNLSPDRKQIVGYWLELSHENFFKLPDNLQELSAYIIQSFGVDSKVNGHNIQLYTYTGRIFTADAVFKIAFDLLRAREYIRHNCTP